jgi:hypothetical protein
MRLHRILTLVALAASLTAFTACGDDDTDDTDTAGTTDETGSGSTSTGGSDPTGGTEETTPDGGELDAELVAFVGGSSSGTDAPPALLATPEQVAAWIGWFETADASQADELRSALADEPEGDDTVLAAFVAFGCAEDSATLVVAGSDLAVDLTGGEEIDCAEAVRFAVVFAVDRAALPATPTLAGQPVPERVGPGELVVFVHAGTTVTSSSEVVVLDGVSVDGWIGELTDASPEVGDEVAAAVAGTGTDEVALGAVLSGCAEESAELVVGPDAGLSMELIGPDDIDCDAPDTYVAVIVVPAELVGR